MLIVDDDPAHRALVARILAPLDLVVDEADDALAALERMADHQPRIVIVDLGSPPSGRAVFLEDLRKCSTAPVVVVSSTAGELDLVDALLLGADDYLAKPVSPGELMARVGAVLRRSQQTKEAMVSQLLSFGALEVNLATREVFMGGRSIAMRAREFDLLAHLVSDPMRVFSRQELLAAVWSSSGEWQKLSTVTEHIRRIRIRLGQDGAHDGAIATVRNAGYRFDPSGCRRGSKATR